MFSSLPDYRRFADAALKRFRKDNKREPSNRLGRMMLNLVLLAGLWGLPLYARWIVLADRNSTNSTSENITKTTPETKINISEAIVGKWRPVDGSHFSITFTRDGKFVVSWKETIVETAHYQFGVWFPKINRAVRLPRAAGRSSRCKRQHVLVPSILDGE